MAEYTFLIIYYAMFYLYKMEWVIASYESQDSYFSNLGSSKRQDSFLQEYGMVIDYAVWSWRETVGDSGTDEDEFPLPVGGVCSFPGVHVCIYIYV